MAIPDPSQPKRFSPLGIIIAVGAAGLLLVLLFFHSSPRDDVSIEQSQMAAALVTRMMTNGVLVNYDCATNTSWVNRAVWEKYNAEQKRNITISLATMCNTQHAGYRISVLDYDTKREIASFDGRNLVLDK
jgi:hypothetical protein